MPPNDHTASFADFELLFSDHASALNDLVQPSAPGYSAAL